MDKETMSNDEPKEEKLTLKSLGSQIVKINKTLDLLAKIVTAPKEDKPVKQEVAAETKSTEGEPDVTMIPPAFRKVVDEELGTDFGINMVWPGDNNNSGVLFKLIVPTEKSNMEKDKREMFKVDVRTKNLAGNPTVDEVRKYCKLVKSNLLKTQQNVLN